MTDGWVIKRTRPPSVELNEIFCRIHKSSVPIISQEGPTSRKSLQITHYQYPTSSTQEDSINGQERNTANHLPICALQGMR